MEIPLETSEEAQNSTTLAFARVDGRPRTECAVDRGECRAGMVSLGTLVLQFERGHAAAVFHCLARSSPDQ